ncbi:MAG: DUF309 domain-containing protein [Verrucomicrobiota bacterium]|nr:DUF309 domain-containing protein [Verrucomicrobiota bacterium]
MSKRERISDFVGAHESGSADDAYYAAFFRLWNEARYYEAHDVLEQLWLVEQDETRARFYQALIQAAGAFVHLQKNFEQPTHAKHATKMRPAARLFALALRNVEGLPKEFRELDVVALRQLLTNYREKIIAADHAANPWSPATAPKLSPRG